VQDAVESRMRDMDLATQRSLRVSVAPVMSVMVVVRWHLSNSCVARFTYNMK
jgi:hypothetical protein